MDRVPLMATPHRQLEAPIHYRLPAVQGMVDVAVGQPSSRT